MSAPSQKAPNGYIGIVSALVLSGILTTLVFTSSMRALFSRFSEADGENKATSMLLARSCSFIALRTYIDYPVHVSSSTKISLSDDTRCYIDSVSQTGNSIFTLTHADVGTSHTYLHTSAIQRAGIGTSISITSWNEN